MRDDPLARPSTLTFGVAPLVIAALAATTFVSAGAVAVTRSGADLVGRVPGAAGKPSAIDRLIPADVVGFARVTLDPAHPQRVALNRLVATVTPRARRAILRSLEDALDDAVPGTLRASRLVPALGAEIAVAFRATGRRVHRVAVLQTRDAARARSLLAPTLRRGDTMEVVGRVLYVGPARAVRDLRAAASRSAIATDPAYVRELAATGDGFATGWLNGARLAQTALIDSQRMSSIAGASIEDVSKTTAVAVARVEGQTLTVRTRATGGITVGARASVPRLFDGAPSSIVGGVVMIDPVARIRSLIGRGGGAGGEGAEPFGRLGGVDLERSVLSWLGNEVVLVAVTPKEFGGIVALRDPAAFDAVLTQFRPALAAAGFTQEGDGFTFRLAGMSIVARRDRGTLALGVAPGVVRARRIATDLLAGTARSLDKDPAYLAMFGAAQPTTLRMFVRLSAFRELLPGSTDRDDLEIARHLDAVGFEERVDGRVSVARLALMFS